MADENPFAKYAPSGTAPVSEGENPFARYAPSDVTPATEGAPARITVRPPGTEPTADSAFARAFTNAASFGFRDELAGLAAAGGAPPAAEQTPDPALALFHIGRGAYRKLTGDPEAQQRYETETARQREETKQLAEESPIESTLGTLGGAVAVPFGIAARGVGWGARALAAARTGAVQGGLTGLGEAEGDLGERLPSAVMGSGIGAGIGLVASPVISLVGEGVRRILGPTLNIARAIRGVPPTEEARRFVDVASKDVAARDVGLSGAQADLARARGQPVMAVDQFGTNTKALARAAADASPEARAIMQPELADRLTERPIRTAKFIGDMSNHADPLELQAAIRTVGSLENRPLYARAYAEGDRNIGLENPELNHLLSAPAVQEAMKGAVTHWRDRQVAAGYGNLKSPIDIDPRTQELVFTNSRGFPTFPNIQLWDYTARNLEARAARARNAGDRDEAQYIGGFATRLKAALDEEVPSFKAARASANEFRGSENALDFGREFFGSNTTKTYREKLAAFNKLTDQQKAISQDGYLAAVTDKVNTGAIPKLTPSFRNEMQTVLGMEKAAKIEDWLRVETLMEQSRFAVAGGSPTSRLLQDAKKYAQSPLSVGAAGAGAGAFISGDYDPRNPATIAGAVLAGIGSKRWNASNAAVMRQVAERLMSSDPAEYSKAIQSITAMPGWRRALHEATDALKPGPAAIGRVGGTLAGESQGP